MASKDWPRAMRQSRHEDRTQAPSSISHAIFTSWHSDNQSLLTEMERGGQEITQMHGVSKWNQSTKLHCDFISFLAICQWRGIDILGITWQPALERVGRGATAHIYQSQINPQISFAFKSITPSSFGSDEFTIFRTLISEVLVLGHPVIRNHANIVTLMGICWDVATSGVGEDTVWPVLVYEKAECGDLTQFMESEVGRDLPFDQRLHLCIDIGTALMVMHSCSTFHGDVKPKNVLIFQEDSGRYVAKVSDLGFSSLATTDDCITVPRTRPWNGPEWHHRGFTLNGVKKLDVYSFGMLCLWLLCKDALFKTPRRPSPILKEWDGADLFTQHTEAIPGRTFLEALKADDQMPILAHELLTLTAGLDQERKSKLSRLFLLCLASEPTDRSSDFVELLELLSQARITPPPITDIGQGEVYLPPPFPFQVAKSFISLMDVDYRVRKHIFCCLKLQATSYHCKACHDSAAFQVAFCYKVGFGISSSEDQVRYWLGDERTLEDLERELEIVRNADWSHTDTITKLLDEGYYIQMDYSGEYQRAGILEASVAEYVREMRDMERVLGRLHPVIRRLKSVLAECHFQKDEIERAEILYREVKVQLEDDPEYGHEDFLTLVATTNLANVLTELAKYEAAEEMYNRTLSGYEKLLGPSHPSTLLNIHRLALLSQYQGKYKRAETLCRQALEGEIAVLGESHINALDTLNTLGMILRSQGKYEEAEEVYRRELRLTKLASGQESPQTMFAISELAVLSRLQGKYKTAENLSQQAIDGLEKMFGKENSNTLACIEDLAWTLEEQGKSAEAEGLHRRVLAGRERFLGSTHPDVLGTQEALAGTLSAQGDHKRAEEMTRQVVVKKKEVLGPVHVDTLAAMGNLAIVLFRQRKLTAAANLFTQALQKREKLFEEDNPSTLTNMNDLAVVLAAQGRYAQAVTLYKCALAGRRRVLGTHHPDTLTTCNNLAAALTRVGQSTEAETIFRDILVHVAAASDSSDIDEPDTATVMWNLADLLHRQKRFDEAYPLYERACEEYERSGRPQREDCEEQFKDMRKERERRARGGIWRLDAVHALVGVGEVVREGVVRVGKGLFR